MSVFGMSLMHQKLEQEFVWGMAFLLSGGVSCIPAAIAVWVLARPPVSGAYIGFSFIGACLLGMFYGILA